jgi:hypothetical protein
VAPVLICVAPVLICVAPVLICVAPVLICVAPVLGGLTSDGPVVPRSKCYERQRVAILCLWRRHAKYTRRAARLVAKV